ncbi:MULTISPECIES: ABC transporter substrate-binding protein [Methylocaldum]|jgi:multiple sugar transport system substrate-binding protein|uniref:ABC transporter substrate-binding protein n=2 Tax=Methylocaldum TaxID=73778 RepID=UPI001B4B72D0|nr:ABC transporter substrate-binding protein [Methylocaldum sp. RMAD-M]MBP1152159.1 multiple sugar transport system substrate-binding protein [Methylocaldum sp. RMAD-M]
MDFRMGVYRLRAGRFFQVNKWPARISSRCSIALLRLLFLLSLGLPAWSCRNPEPVGPPHLTWYVFDEPSGAFREAARRCTEFAKDRYRIDVVSLPADADQQREQLTRRLAAGDESIDIIGMDVIWTAEFAEAGWIREWPMRSTRRASAGRFPITVQTATYKNVFWATPFTTNVQLLWYRTDRVPTPPDTWDEMIDSAEKLGRNGRIQVQGERYEGLTVLFVSLLASAGGTVLDAGGQQVSLEPEPTRKALQVMKRLATSPAADPGLSTSREDQARLAFETGNSAFMLNYTFVWPSARQNAPDVAANMGWARWPAVLPGRPSRVTVGGIDLAVSTYSRYPELAFNAAECLASRDNQRIAAQRGGLPPTVSALYNDPAVRRRLPFADVLRAALNDAVERPQTPLYADVSLAISRTLHPMRDIEPDRDTTRLRKAVQRALRSEGLL